MTWLPQIDIYYDTQTLTLKNSNRTEPSDSAVIDNFLLLTEFLNKKVLFPLK